MLQLLFVDIEKFPVTNAEYWEFCEATSRDKGRTAKGRPRQPVVYVSWFDAMDYACWRATRDGIPWRLPTEAELSAAERLVPEDSDFGAWPLPELPDVDAHPEIVNCLGHECLLGVIYQWTMREEDKAVYDTMWAKYSKRRAKREMNAEAKARGLTFDAHTQVNMGGAWYDAGNLISADSQCDLIPKYEGHDTGFRLAADGDDSSKICRGNQSGAYSQDAGVAYRYGSDATSRGSGLGFRLAADTDEDRVVRGGTWKGTSDLAQEPLSGWYPPEDDVSFLGFRLAVDAEERGYRGGRWFTGADSSKSVIATGCDPAWSGEAVGLRLVVDADAGRVFRGGSWYNSAQSARVAFHCGDDPTNSDDDLGFRLAVDADADRQYRGGCSNEPQWLARRGYADDDNPQNRHYSVGFRLAVDTVVDRVFRGGSWSGSARLASVALRLGFDPSIRRDYLGFRLAVDTEIDRVFHGGSWVIDASFARVANRRRNDPADAGSLIGFRLAADTDNNKEDK